MFVAIDKKSNVLINHDHEVFTLSNKLARTNHNVK